MFAAFLDDAPLPFLRYSDAGPKPLLRVLRRYARADRFFGGDRCLSEWWRIQRLILVFVREFDG
jgi:hypothetical protein